MTANANPVHWFELPVTDMDRAVKFYEDVFGHTFRRQKMGDMELAFFPSNQEQWGCSGMLVKHEKSVPSSQGTMVYFRPPSGDLANELAKVESAGGTVWTPKTSIQEYGFMAIFSDTEGNAVGMQSMQ